MRFRGFIGRTLRSRISIFLILLLFISSGGFVFMALSQDSMTQSSTRIREILLPAGRLIENAKREVDLQVHELSLLSTFEVTRRELGTQQRALLRLSPSVQSLVRLHSSSLFPLALSELFSPWAQTVRSYQERIPHFETYDEASRALVELRSRTHILQRAIDRELSVQLIQMSEASQQYLLYWAIALILAFISSAAFARLVWKWMEPLGSLKNYLASASSQEKVAPPSFMGKGLHTPPQEILELSEVFRKHVIEFREQKKTLLEREDKLLESHRSLSTLFAAISHLLRHNEKLIAELIKKERLASMSEMAAQLAHEIKNPLNSMSLKLELLRDELNPEQVKILDRILDEIDRLDALTESHLSQTRGGLAGQWNLLLQEPGESSPKLLGEEIADLFESSFKEKGIHLSREFGATDTPLAIPKNILKSALINLIKNAEEAQAKNIRIEMHSDTLRILDDGCGFPEKYRQNPFEIFRTSKEKGSGLGLVTTHKMLEAYNMEMNLLEAPSPFTTCWELRTQKNVSLAAISVPKQETTL